MITLYGSRRSRAMRCLWALEELGLEYEHEAFDQADDETHSKAYLALNPAGKVPTLVDGESVLFESIAINLYLAMTYGEGSLWPKDRRGRALALQWSVWAAAEAEPPIVVLARERVFKPAPSRNEKLAAAAEKELAPRLSVLETVLGRAGPFLNGSPFSIGDLNVAAVLGIVRVTGFDLGSWPKVNGWLETALSRPAYQRAMGR